MEIERLTFLLTAIGTLGYVLIKKRQADWFLVAATAGVVYFLPSFFGYMEDPNQQRLINVEGGTYLTHSFVFASIALGALFQDAALTVDMNRSAHKRLSAPNDRYVTLVLIIMALISLIATIMEMGDSVLIAEKEILMEKSGRWLIAYEFSACLAFLTALASGNRKTAMFAATLLLPSVFWGYRTAVVMTLLGMCMMRLRSAGRIVVVSKWRYWLLGILALCALMLLKQFQYPLKYGVETGQWSLLIDQIQNKDLYLDALFTSEPFIVQNTLNEIMRVDFSVGIEQLESLAVSMLPFGNELGLPEKGFNDFFQPVLFPDIQWGLAGNIWAQAYSLGSFGMVLVFCVFFIGILTIINIAFARTSGSLLAAVALTGAYWAFYVHRNDLMFQFLLQRRVWVFFLFAWGISYLLSMKPRVQLVDIRSS